MRFLMLTHDQEIDPRILRQAEALLEDGWEGTIICLSFDGENHDEIMNRLEIKRVGLNHIKPPCPVYRKFMARQLKVLAWTYTRPHQILNGRSQVLGKMVDVTFRTISRLNWALYLLHLRVFYHNLKLFCPLPLDETFYETGQSVECDLIVAHDLPSLPAGVRLAKERAVPLLYDSHELYCDQDTFSLKQKRMMREVERECIHQCTLSFIPNDLAADRMVELYGCKRPLVLQNVTDPPQGFDPDLKENRLRKHFGLSDDRFIILYQGGLLAHRNLELLVRAMSHVSNSRAVLVFMGDGGLKDHLQKMVGQAGLQDRVLFKEAVSQADLIFWTASADLGIIPYPAFDINSSYSTPNKLYEYIQACLPILANDLVNLRRYVKETGFGTVVPLEDPSTIAKFIDEMIERSDLLEAFKRELKKGRYCFSWSAAKADYLDNIKRVMKEHHHEREFSIFSTTAPDVGR